MASVKALPDAFPAFRMFAISASLLVFRMSLMMSFRGVMLLDSRTLVRPSALDERSLRKREKNDLVLVSKGKSV
jgi:hypothetical protein